MMLPTLIETYVELNINSNVVDSLFLTIGRLLKLNLLTLPDIINLNLFGTISKLLSSNQSNHMRMREVSDILITLFTVKEAEQNVPGMNNDEH